MHNARGSELDRSAFGNRFTFQGRVLDWDTGLYNFRARWYDAETGRWISKDPLGISGGLNLYEAFGNNPVNFIDPMGERWSQSEADIGTAALGGLLAGLGVGGLVGAGLGLIITIGGIKFAQWKEINKHWKESKKE